MKKIYFLIVFVVAAVAIHAQNNLFVICCSMVQIYYSAFLHTTSTLFPSAKVVAKI